jgi:hypothetical protein
MVNYASAKIYKIVCDTTNKTYIGSTTVSLSRRLTQHLTEYNRYKNGKTINRFTSFELFDNSNYKIILIEECPCENREQLFRKEREHIDANVCVNKLMPIRYEQEKKDLLKKRNDENYAKNRIELLEYQKQYAKENPEKLKEYKDAYYQENKTELLEKNKEYRKNNIETVKKRDKDKYERNKEKLLEQSKNRYENNKTTILEQQKHRREVNKPTILENERLRREANKDSLNQYKREYYAKNKEKILEQQRLARLK